MPVTLGFCPAPGNAGPTLFLPAPTAAVLRGALGLALELGCRAGSWRRARPSPRGLYVLGSQPDLSSWRGQLP